MDFVAFYSSDIFKWIILPLLIFCARLIDVSLGTLRIIFVSHGIKYLAPIIGFFEVSIWLVAISQIMTNLNNIVCGIAYAAGFASGNFIGLLLEERLSIGTVILRIIIKHDDQKLIECLQKSGYGVTLVDALGVKGPVKIILAVMRREDLKEVLSQVEQAHPHAFYSIEDVRSVGEAIFPSRHKNWLPHPIRKGK